MDGAYVTNRAWHAHESRSDAIDDIADQFERPAPGARAFWLGVPAQRAARQARIAPRERDRRAG